LFDDATFEVIGNVSRKDIIIYRQTTKIGQLYIQPPCIRIHLRSFIVKSFSLKCILVEL